MSVDASAVARVVGITTEFKNLRAGNVVFLPQRVALIGQGTTVAQASYSNDKRTVTSALEVGQTYGFGSPLHLAALQLLPVNGDGIGSIPLTVYPLDDDAAGVVSTGDITPSGSPSSQASFRVRVNNILSEPFVVSVGDVVADIVDAMVIAINAVLEMPIIAADGTTKLDFTSKWEGASANDIVVEVVTSANTIPTTEELAGNVFTITQPVGGLNNPDVQSALDQIGNVWETLVLNCMEIADTTTLGKYDTFGEGRWGALVRKPLVVFTGNTATTVAAAIAVPDARKTDKTNAQLVAPGSNDLPFVVAARQLARIAVIANNNLPVDYGSQDASGLVPGADGDQWTYTERDQAVKGGSSTIEVRDGVINLSDTITFYHPDGDPTPAYRYVVDIIKLQNILFNLDLIFVTPEWDGAPLIPDNQPTTNRSAKKPKSAVAAIAALVDSLGLNAIISDPATAKASISANINESNPKRLDVVFTIQLAGNTNIISIDFNFGFFFGTQPVVA
jgi:phage tail sheath gpL-like